MPSMQERISAARREQELAVVADEANRQQQSIEYQATLAAEQAEDQLYIESVQNDPRFQHLIRVGNDPELIEALTAYFDHFAVKSVATEKKRGFWSGKKPTPANNPNFIHSVYAQPVEYYKTRNPWPDRGIKKARPRRREVGQHYDNPVGSVFVNGITITWFQRRNTEGQLSIAVTDSRVIKTNSIGEADLEDMIYETSSVDKFIDYIVGKIARNIPIEGLESGYTPSRNYLRIY